VRERRFLSVVLGMIQLLSAGFGGWVQHGYHHDGYGYFFGLLGRRRRFTSERCQCQCGVALLGGMTLLIRAVPTTKSVP
jgi:hypothetical protein